MHLYRWIRTGLQLSVVAQLMLWGDVTSANKFKRQPIPKGTMIMVGQYASAVHAYRVTMIDAPEMGPYYADVLAVASAADIDGKDSLQKKPQRLEHSQVMLKHSLDLLNDEEFAIRQKKFSREK